VKKRFLPFLLAGALAAGIAAPAAAQDSCDITQVVQRPGLPGLAGLITAVVEANVGVQVCHVDVDALNNSLNNLLQNANIQVLNNALNNLLQNADINVEVISGSPITVSVLGGPVIIFD